jgi:hypothetical protein
MFSFLNFVFYVKSFIFYKRIMGAIVLVTM